MIADRLGLEQFWIYRLKKDLTADRYAHSVSVAETAYYLAIVHKVNAKKVVKAAFLHDCAKCKRLDEQRRICELFGYTPSTYEANNAGLLHSKAGVYVAKEVYGVKSKKILNAICYHTTGRPKMSKVEKIVFISDFIEPKRKFKFDIEHIVEAAFEDLDLAVFYILEANINYLKNKSKVFDPTTIKTYNYYKEIKEERYGKD